MMILPDGGTGNGLRLIVQQIRHTSGIIFSGLGAEKPRLNAIIQELCMRGTN